MRLMEIKEIVGTIEVLSGLHIGSGNAEMHIGGSDNPVIRHPHTNHPYIPGSSLKGKVRSLLEWRAGLAAVNDGKPMSYGKLQDAPDREEALNILKLFGVSDQLSKEDAEEIGPSRLAFRDCPLDEAWLTEMGKKTVHLTETKMENTIDRVRGVARDPRSVERVPAGSLFQFALSVKILDRDGPELLKTLFIGLQLLEMDSLGGSGSRGYGRIKFTFKDDGAHWAEQLRCAKPW